MQRGTGGGLDELLWNPTGKLLNFPSDSVWQSSVKQSHRAQFPTDVQDFSRQITELSPEEQMNGLIMTALIGRVKGFRS